MAPTTFRLSGLDKEPSFDTSTITDLASLKTAISSNFGVAKPEGLSFHRPDKKKDGSFWPVGIAVSKRLNKFFWTQKGHSKANEGRIFAASLDLPNGVNPASRPDIEIIASGLPECIDLDFDDESGVLYWTDRGELPFGNTLNKKQIIGETPAAEKALGRQVIAQGLAEGIGLRLDKTNNCIYVADIGGHLWKCSNETGLKEKLYEVPTHASSGLTFYKF